MKMKSRCISFLLSLTVLVMVTPVLAKGPVDKITIEGPGLASPIEITDSEILSRFDPWGGQFIGTGGPLAGPPPNVKEPYLVKFYLEDQQGNLTLRYMFYYYFNPAETTGYIYLPGPGEPYYQINTGTIIRGKSDGQWHKAIPGWDNVMTDVVAQSRVGFSSFENLNPAQVAAVFVGIGMLLVVVIASYHWFRRWSNSTA
jgi:hypothetical protein